jgi:hypothetical protein
LLVGRARFESHVILSTTILIVAPLWRTIAVPVTPGIPLPPSTLLLCTLAKHTLQPMPIIGVEVIEGALGASPEVTAAAIHRRRRRLADETRERVVGSRSAPPPRHVRERSGRG